MASAAAFAICVFRFLGYLQLEQREPSLPLKVYGNLTNLTPGLHAMHVHILGNTMNNCTMTGNHFNPYGFEHGGPDDFRRHAGDFGNIVADENGVADIDKIFSRVSLYYPSILGRSIVVHQNEDDLGLGNASASKLNGNSGSRVDCCAIGSAAKAI